MPPEKICASIDQISKIMNPFNLVRLRAASRCRTSNQPMWHAEACISVHPLSAIVSPPKCLRQFATNLRDGPNISGKVLAIRRETFSIWERRAPLSPSHVRKLVRKGVKVLVQPSNRRDYSMQEYTEAGAVIQEDLNEASVIMGVKQIPIDMLIPNRTYCFFSHTIKAQSDNMPLLDAILEKNIRLIDYEKMCDQHGQRVVAFGMFAGVAGMINILNGLGIRLLALGHHTPFMHIGPAHNYRNSEIAKQALRDCGYGISLGRMPKSIGPLTFVFTGSGNVSQGAQNMFAELPHEFIEPEDLPKIATSGATNKVYGCVVSREDHYFRLDGGPFNADEFSKFPQRYGTNFSKTIAPYASVIINGIYWSPSSPRLVSIPDAKSLLHPQEQPWLTSSPGCPTLPHRLLAICDISADPGGSIEFMTACTTIDKPFCLYDANQNSSQESFSGPGVLVCSIENMPAQLPREATDYFGNLLLPHIPLMLQSDAKQPFEQFRVDDVVRRAVIATNGTLAPDYRYITELREHKYTSKRFESRSGKRVLVLGSGYVSQPLIDYLSRDENINITVASNLREELDRVTQKQKRFNNVESLVVDVERHINTAGGDSLTGESANKLEQLIGQHELVVSLLPVPLHNNIARMCIARRVNMLTASYSKTLVDAGLDRAAEEAGVTFLYEVGLDPGIDHLLAMECFDEVRERGGQVESFTSFCGGLPAPEHANNPLRYKFSWSPRGMLAAMKSTAQFLDNGQVKQVKGGGLDLLSHYCQPLDAYPALNLQYFPNRDSLLYRTLYGIDSPACKTCLRGTIRYKGYAEALQTLIVCGLLDEHAMPLLHTKGPDVTWRQLMAAIFGQNADIHQANLKRVIQERKKLDKQQIELLEELGLLSDEIVVKANTLLDTLALHLASKLKFSESERDLTILRHDITINWGSSGAARKDGGGLEHRAISMVVYGDQPNGGYSAMAKTVGYTAGIAAKMLVDGEIQRKGLVLPLTKEIYRPLLMRLQQQGITYQVDSVMGERSASTWTSSTGLSASASATATLQEAAAAELSQR